jgi:hypothetical protein
LLFVAIGFDVLAYAEFQHSMGENLLVTMVARGIGERSDAVLRTAMPGHDEESAGCRIDGVWLSTAYL